MLDLRRSPAWPGQAVVLALDRTAHPQRRGAVELVLMLHVQLQAFGRLAGIADCPGAAVDLAKDVFRHRYTVLDTDVLEQLVGEAELLGEEIGDLVVRLRLEDRVDHLFPPLYGALRVGHRAGHFHRRSRRQQVGTLLTVR